MITGCPLCYGREGEHCQILPDSGGDWITFDCFVCGRFRVSGTVMSDSTKNSNLQVGEDWRAFFSHQFKRLTELKPTSISQLPMITSDLIQRCREGHPKLPSPMQQLSLLIIQIGEEFITTGMPFIPSGATRTSIGSLNQDQMQSIELMGKNAGLIDQRGSGSRKSSRDGTVQRRMIELSWKGWEQFEKARRGATPGNYGFLAMQYGDDLLESFAADVMKPAIKDGIGYELIDLRDVAQAGIIDNLLRERIRDSAFVIVDLTHDNSGAYWEAGYAEGLGKPVIYICEKNKFNEKRTHFDTNHCTTVPWLADQGKLFADELVATLRRSMNLF